MPSPLPPDPFVRVYYRILDDPRFKDVYADDEALATWLRLLIGANAMWPAPAVLPRSAKDSAVTKLVDAGLIELLPNDQYRVHGLDAERQRQAERGKAGAEARWGKRDDAPAAPRKSQRTPPAPRPQTLPDANALPPQSVPDANALPSTTPRNAHNTAPIRPFPTGTDRMRVADATTTDDPGAVVVAPRPVPLSDLLPPPPGHARNRRHLPDDEELVERYKAKADDRTLVEPLRMAAEDQLRIMGWVRAPDASWVPRSDA